MKPKKLTMNLQKTADGYILSSEEIGRVEYFNDDDVSRQALIKALGNIVFEVMNTEVENGNKYS